MAIFQNMHADQLATRAIVAAGQLVLRFGVEASGEAMIKQMECEIAGKLAAAAFWQTVRLEVMDILIATHTGRSTSANDQH